MSHTSSVGHRALAGSQMLLVAFGALVLMPLVTGLDPNVALFTAGIGTLIFQLCTGRMVPVFLASSFAFISPILYSNTQFGLSATLGGLVAAGVLYMLLAGLVRLRGTDFIHRLLPPVVIGPVIMVIGLGLAPLAANMAMGKTGDGATELVGYGTALIISGASLLTTIVVAILGRGIFRLLPILFGVAVGYGLSFAFGIVDTTKIAAAPWLAMPNFVTPTFEWAAILFMIPVAIAPVVEHIGDVVVISSVTGKNFVQKPGLHRTLLGDGLATSAAAMVGGPPNTTYSEVTGAVVLTKNFDPRVMTWAAISAILLAFVGKFGAALQAIPVPVMGGILCLLFGTIATVGLNTLVHRQVNLMIPRNLVIVSVTLVFGIGGLVLGGESLAFQGIALAAITAIVLNLVLPGYKAAQSQEQLRSEL